MNKITLQDFEKIIPLVWSKETCYEPWQDVWASENKAKGQCYVTAKLFQDIFGGKIIKAKDTTRTSHYWNILDSNEYDFTKSQYSEDEVFTNKEVLDTIQENERSKKLTINFFTKILEDEGFPIVYEWKDDPHTKYENHSHKGKVSFFVVEGEVTFSGGIQKTVKKNERINVPVGVEHTAIVGSGGCTYVVGQEIEGDA